MAGTLAAGVIALGAGELLRQPASSASDGTALVLGPSGSVAAAPPAASLHSAASDLNSPSIAVVGDVAGASSLVRSLQAAGLHAGLSDSPRAGTLGLVTHPTVLYRPAAGASAVASRAAAVLSTRLPGTTVAPMPRSTDTSSLSSVSSVVVLLPAVR